MSRLRNEIAIAAPPQAIYSRASATERWPQFLPHYRYVRVLENRGDRRLVEMAARRGIIPVRWRAEQANDADLPSIRFTHVCGWTKGMEVEWRFTPMEGVTRVSIDHIFPADYALPEPIARHVVASFFIDHIATRTLHCLKELCERSQ